MMHTKETHYSRRTFLKATALTGGGFMLGINWLSAATPEDKAKILNIDNQWFELNTYVKIMADNSVQIMAHNPEFGQNVKTSLPMLVAEELDVDWTTVSVEQAPFDAVKYPRQFTGGSQSVRMTWKPLRTAGATAREMLRAAAAQKWQVPLDEITTNQGHVYHTPSGRSETYGALAGLAATLPIPQNVRLKPIKDFKIIRTSKKNVDGLKIVTGQPLFGIDYKAKDMQIAMIEHPPAFGLKLKSFDATAALKMPGITHVFAFNVYNEGYEKQGFDTRTFNDLVAIVGKTTWEVLNARKQLKIEWTPIEETKEKVNTRSGKSFEIIPAGLESSDMHQQQLRAMLTKAATVLRKDGNPEAVFDKATHIIERTYTAPFLAHNCMEPMNCFAHVTPDAAFIAAPIQIPEFPERTLAARLGLPLDKIEIQVMRMGGGFGRRAYGHYMIEAAVISQKINAPVKLLYTREDDMSYGIYRPMYIATYRAAFDANKNLIGFHVKGGGVPEHPIHANRFPAGAIEHYLAEGFEIKSNITIGAFRAPRSNFNAAAEQSFLDEIAEFMGKDPIDLRLEWLEKAQKNPVGQNNDYDAARYAEVLKLVREKSDWDNPTNKGKKRGVAAYFCHNSYAAHVVEVNAEPDNLSIEKVISAIDCGIVINPDAAKNMVEGAVVDAIGNALYGSMTFDKGETEHKNLNTYRVIRHNEAPKQIDVHFVNSDTDPTGLGEPPFPPVFAALANALYKATGKRFYEQPFSKTLDTL